VQDASLKLHEGEVLCIAGLVGSGRTELLRLIAGVDPADGAAFWSTAWCPVTIRAAASGLGLGLLPEERKRDGIIRHRPITTNIALPAMRRFSRWV
jgi:ribose transport system ATP-binding protein